MTVSAAALFLLLWVVFDIRTSSHGKALYERYYESAAEVEGTALASVEESKGLYAARRKISPDMEPETKSGFAEGPSDGAGLATQHQDLENVIRQMILVKQFGGESDISTPGPTVTPTSFLTRQSTESPLTEINLSSPFNEAGSTEIPTSTAEALIKVSQRPPSTREFQRLGAGNGSEQRPSEAQALNLNATETEPPHVSPTIGQPLPSIVSPAPRLGGFGTGQPTGWPLTVEPSTKAVAFDSEFTEVDETNLPLSATGSPMISINAGSASDPGPVVSNDTGKHPTGTWIAKIGTELPANYESLGFDKSQAERLLSHRFGYSFEYEFSLQSGTYRVSLAFAEMYLPNCDNSRRVFSVYINGKAVAEIDTFEMSGGCELGFILQVTGLQVSSGVPLSIGFRTLQGDNAFVSAIDIYDALSAEEHGFESLADTFEPSPEETPDETAEPSAAIQIEEADGDSTGAYSRVRMFIQRAIPLLG